MATFISTVFAQLMGRSLGAGNILTNLIFIVNGSVVLTLPFQFLDFLKPGKLRTFVIPKLAP